MQHPACLACQSRRQFVTQVAGLTAVAAMGQILSGCAAEPGEVPVPDAGQEVLDLTLAPHAPLQNVGGAIKHRWKNGAPVIVRRKATDTYEAYSASCTHEGCEVPLPSGNSIECPCHGATYNADGVRLSGPARSNLKPGTVSLAGTDLTITFT